MTRKRSFLVAWENAVRIAGTAEFAGYNTRIRQKRVTPLLRRTEALFPGAAETVLHAEKMGLPTPTNS